MYLVIEIQTAANGTVTTLTTQHPTQYEAESKYHTVLASAAISSLPAHAAVLMYHYGNVLMSQHYTHEQPEPEPDEEPGEE